MAITDQVNDSLLQALVDLWDAFLVLNRGQNVPLPIGGSMGFFFNFVSCLEVLAKYKIGLLSDVARQILDLPLKGNHLVIILWFVFAMFFVKKR